MSSLTAIVPFFNEGRNVLAVVRSLTRAKGITQIICVDDGSTDDAAERIREQFPHVTLIRLKKNVGKSEAVQFALKRVKNKNVLLMDADLKNLRPQWIERAIQRFGENKEIGMILLENKMYGARRDWWVFLSGQRLVRTDDLKKFFRSHAISGWALEVALNEYMIRHRKKVFHMKNASYNPYKIQKRGLAAGVKGELRMAKDILACIGPVGWFKQAFVFGHEELR